MCSLSAPRRVYMLVTHKKKKWLSYMETELTIRLLLYYCPRLCSNTNTNHLKFFINFEAMCPWLVRHTETKATCMFLKVTAFFASCSHSCDYSDINSNSSLSRIYISLFTASKTVLLHSFFNIMVAYMTFIHGTDWVYNQGLLLIFIWSCVTFDFVTKSTILDF